MALNSPGQIEGLDGQTSERLDRGICNVDWLSLFPKVGVRHLAAPNSDHNPNVLDTHLDLSKGTKPFRFETM